MENESLDQNKHDSLKYYHFKISIENYILVLCIYSWYLFH